MRMPGQIPLCGTIGALLKKRGIIERDSENA
jgi:hypothetical protein